MAGLSLFFSSLGLLFCFCWYKREMKEQRLSVTKKMRGTQLVIFHSMKVADSFCYSFLFSLNAFFPINLQANLLSENVAKGS